MSAIWNDEVADWVNSNRGSICLMIFEYFPECPKETVEDFCREAYVLAMSSVVTATTMNRRFEQLFWNDFRRFLKHSQRHENMLRYSPDALNSPLANVGQRYTDDLFDRFHREKMFNKASGIICDILSPHEERVFHLLFGETEHGCCSVREAAEILNMSWRAVHYAYDKIIRKIEESDTLIDWDGGEFDLDWQSMAKAVPFARGRFSSVLGAVLRRREIFLMNVSSMVAGPIEDHHEANAA